MASQVEQGSSARRAIMKASDTKKYKFFIFSDESGSWHDPNDIYVRAWIVVGEDTYEKKLFPKIDEIASFMDANELKWSGFSNLDKYFNEFDDISFRVFVTISSPSDINWEKKYNVTKKFETSVQTFSFGEIDKDLVKYLKERMYRDIKNALFLHYYEKLHIENAKNGIESVIRPEEYDLIYRIDPPQMSHKGWYDILCKISGTTKVNLEFPKSERTQGIQFADLIAGAFRSYIIEDEQINKAKIFLSNLKSKTIYQDGNPNPNLIMFEEINDKIKNRIKSYWEL